MSLSDGRNFLIFFLVCLSFGIPEVGVNSLELICIACGRAEVLSVVWSVDEVLECLFQFASLQYVITFIGGCTGLDLGVEV